ncbi:helix-turn-helix domain containing protein [Streptomyces sp. NPDC051976]|uniref:helix-turn-helix domain-containing protein n=1 Tax=Streptomyces sp. NPDC051976 TaxID=3154947 RepID=UPI0034300643
MTATLSAAAEARRRQAVELGRRYDEGASVEELERETGLSHGTVVNRLRHAGTVMRTPAQTRRLRAGEEQEQARRALGVRLRAEYTAGASVEALALQEGLSARTVRRRLTDVGAVLRSGQETRRARADALSVEARRRLAAELRRGYEAGDGVPDLAVAFGTSVSTVYRLLRQAHTVMQPPHRHGRRDRAARPP